MYSFFCAYILGLYFTGVSLPAQKLSVECWWNWHQGASKTAVESWREQKESDLANDGYNKHTWNGKEQK